MISESPKGIPIESIRKDPSVRRGGSFRDGSAARDEMARYERTREEGTARMPEQLTIDADDDMGWRTELAAAGLCGLTVVLGKYCEWAEYPLWLVAALFGISYLAGMRYQVPSVLNGVREGTFDINFLMLFVALGAGSIGHWAEGAILLFLFSLSKALEDYAGWRTRKEVTSLFKSSPKKARRISPDGSEAEIEVGDIKPGDLLRVFPGELFAVDGRVERGDTAVDESTLTGESVPVEKSPGDFVYAGTVNAWGSVDVAATRGEEESALKRLIHLVEEARESRAPSQRFSERFGSRYTAFVIGLSVCGFAYWWLVRGLPPVVGTDVSESALYRAMTLLVVCSPCALVLSVPSAVLAGIAAGARRGILFRGGESLERLADVTRVALDKTGTLTTGELDLVATETDGSFSPDEALILAASLAYHSTHPVSRGLLRTAERRGIARREISDVVLVSGKGVEGRLTETAVANGVNLEAAPVKLGRRNFMDPNPWVSSCPEPPQGTSEVFFQKGKSYVQFLLRDQVRQQSRTFVSGLCSRHGLKVTMLSGDRPEAAEEIARQIGVDDVRAPLKPEDKVKAIHDWEANGDRVAMIGDGINDVPGLAAATVGVAMGLRGSDAALEEADIILVNDKLEKFADAYALSLRARSVIRQNIVVSLGVVVLLAIGALLEFVPLPLGVVGHEGSTLVVVFNSLRLILRK